MSAIDSLKRLRAELRERLAANPDYVALVNIDRTIREIERIADGAHGFIKKQVFVARVPAMSQADAAAKVIRETGEPIPTPDLLERLREMGVSVGGKDPITNLSSSLSRDERLTSITYKGKRAWWLIGMHHAGEHQFGLDETGPRMESAGDTDGAPAENEV